jgi:proprotein convertase subtilisin/kexin type 5
MLFATMLHSLSCLFFYSASAAGEDSSALFHNQFAVFVPRGASVADDIAARHGFRNVGQIGDLDNYFLFEHARIRRRSAVASEQEALLLLAEPEVEWFQQQQEKRRVKRDGRSEAEDRPLWDSLFQEEQRNSESKVVVKRQMRQASGLFQDPKFGEQWHLNKGARGGFDMNVQPAWNRGFTGKGVVVTILDDGIQTDHPDLVRNYDPRASTDINGNDHDPMPQDNGDNKHGTRCAGEVAASANNGFCGVGVAYNASIGGVRMLDGIVNDAVEARALR